MDSCFYPFSLVPSLPIRICCTLCCSVNEYVAYDDDDDIISSMLLIIGLDEATRV